MSITMKRAYLGVRQRWLQHKSNQDILKISRDVMRKSPAADRGTVVMFNASTRITGISLNAAFSILTSWALRLAGVRVFHLACSSGMRQCVLGTNRNNLNELPPCSRCIYQSTAVYASAETIWFPYQQDENLAKALHGLDIDTYSKFIYKGFPLGRLVLPSIRWVLRRHNLIDDQSTRRLYQNYILSAWNVKQQFIEIIESALPSVVILFNGMFFPEAVARHICREKGIRCISHEVGLQPLSAFFTDGEATAYPIDIPVDFKMSAEQDRLLDDYLQQRFQGNFSMAGIRFWPEIKKLEQSFWDRARGFKQIVPIFTNVIFDTSQGHANVIFSDMFQWLETVKEIIHDHPDTLFVLRAHPDESRSGKASRESVADWVKQNGLDKLENVLFVPPDAYFSSYEIITNSKFVMVYNSTIGLEASLLGTAVLCGGKARFTQVPTVFFPNTAAEYKKMAEDFLAMESISVPPEFKENARKFLYYQVFKTSLPFNGFLRDDGIWPGYVKFNRFSLDMLKPENSPTIKVLLDGILNNQAFLMDS